MCFFLNLQQLLYATFELKSSIKQSKTFLMRGRGRKVFEKGLDNLKKFKANQKINL